MASPNFRCELVNQASYATCELGRSFGCDPASGSMWVTQCRGTFLCASHTVRCGWPPGLPAHNCSCVSPVTAAVAAPEFLPNSTPLPPEGTPFDPGLHTLNLLDNTMHEHHPVMRQVPSLIFPVEREYLVEWNGLRVRARYDCDIFNGDRHFGNHFYFYEVPTRWYACHKHDAALRSGIGFTAPALPMVDDEYHEQVAVYHAVLRAVAAHRVLPKRPLVFAELGARWGTWGSRAIAFGRTLAPSMDYSLLLVEVNRANCNALRDTMAKNAIRYTLECSAATAESLRAWLDEQPHVDAMDWDIQGAEHQLLEHTSDVLEAKVARLIMGTHGGPRAHAAMRNKLVARGWRIVYDVAHQSRMCTAHVSRYLRGYYAKPDNPDRFNWTALLRARGESAEDRCTRDTPRGPVASWDGELIADNPRFVNVSIGFSMSDMTLKAHDLLLPSHAKHERRGPSAAIVLPRSNAVHRAPRD